MDIFDRVLRVAQTEATSSWGQWLPLHTEDVKDSDGDIKYVIFYPREDKNGRVVYVYTYLYSVHGVHLGTEQEKKLFAEKEKLATNIRELHRTKTAYLYDADYCAMKPISNKGITLGYDMIIRCRPYMTLGEYIKLPEVQELLRDSSNDAEQKRIALADNMMNRIMLALKECYQADIVHGRVDFENIWLDRELMNNQEFRLSFPGMRLFVKNQRESRQELNEFAAPELFRDEKNPFDEQTDLYSLGIVLYCLLNEGMFPFQEGKVALEEALRVRNIGMKEIVPPKHGTPLQKYMIRKLLCNSPKNRYQSIAELEVDFGRRYNKADKVDPMSVMTVFEGGAKTQKKNATSENMMTSDAKLTPRQRDEADAYGHSWYLYLSETLHLTPDVCELLRKEFVKMHVAFTELQNRNDNLLQQYDMVHRNSSQDETQLQAKIQKMQKEHEEENSALQQKIKRLSHSVHGFMDEYDKLKAKYDALSVQTQSSDELQKKCMHLVEQCARLQQECDHLQESRKENIQKIAQLEKALTLAQSPSQNNDNLQKLCNRLQKECDKLNEECDYLQSKCKSYLTEISQLKEATKTASTPKDDWQKKYKDLQKQNDTLRGRISVLVDTVQQLQDENESIERENKDLKAQNDELHKKNSVLQNKYNVIQMENNDLQKRMQNVKQENSDLLEKCDTLQKHCAHLQDEAKQKQKDQGGQSSQINQLRKEIDMLKAKSSEKDATIIHLQGDLKQRISQMDEFKQKLSQLQQILQTKEQQQKDEKVKLQKRIKDLETMCSEKDTVIHNLQKQSQQTKTPSQGKDSEQAKYIEKLKAEISDLRKRIDLQKAENQSLNQAAVAWVKAYQELKESYDTLQGHSSA